MKYYHGTTTKFLDNIKKLGLLPAERTGNCSENRKHDRNVVFLTDSYSVAAAYASRAVEKFGGDAIVFEINADAVPKSKRLGRFNQYLMLEFRKIRKITYPPPGMDMEVIRERLHKIVGSNVYADETGRID